MTFVTELSLHIIILTLLIIINNMRKIICEGNKKRSTVALTTAFVIILLSAALTGSLRNTSLSWKLDCFAFERSENAKPGTK